MKRVIQPHKPVGPDRLYSILVAPVITEKSTLASEYGAVVFKVANDADKREIKEAVETLFKVKVRAVNTVVQKGKTKRVRTGLSRKSGFKNARRSDVKKAYVTLEPGHTIDVTSGL